MLKKCYTSLTATVRIVNSSERGNHSDTETILLSRSPRFMTFYLEVHRGLLHPMLSLCVNFGNSNKKWNNSRPLICFPLSLLSLLDLLTPTLMGCVCVCNHPHPMGTYTGGQSDSSITINNSVLNNVIKRNIPVFLVKCNYF